MAAALFLALVIWIGANMSNNPLEQREIDNVRITVELPAGYVLVHSPSPAMASALVRAPQQDWDLLVSEDIEIVADLTDMREPGEYRVEMEGDVMSPLHGQVVAIRPSTLTLSIDKEAEKRVPLRTIVSEEPPLGYTYPTMPACDVTEVTIRGSAERVERVDHAEVRLNLSNDRNPIVGETFPVILVQENGVAISSLDMEPRRVTCSVDVQPREDVTPVEVLPARTDPPPGYLFEGYADITPRTVGVTGDPDAIEEMKSVVRTVPIDLADKTEIFTTEVELDLPPDVRLVSENQLISVTVVISPVRGSRDFPEVPLEPIGLDTTVFQATGLPNTVTVTVVGPEAELPQQNDLRVVVDLSELPPGNHQVMPTVRQVGEPTDSDLNFSVSPEQLSVTIEALNPTPAPASTPGTVTPTGSDDASPSD